MLLSSLNPHRQTFSPLLILLQSANLDLVCHLSENNATESPSVSADNPSLEEGWAMKKSNKSIWFSERVRSYLQETFFQGEETGVKANPADIACKMRSQRSSNGDKLFSKEEWLSTHQVARYFSRLSALNKSGVLKRNVSASQEEEEDLDYISEVEAMETRFQIRRELEL